MLTNREYKFMTLLQTKHTALLSTKKPINLKIRQHFVGFIVISATWFYFITDFSLLPGELPALCIETVCATNFTPLPDALCSIILQMNRRNRPATVSTIKSELESHYRHVQPPSDQVVFEALNNLMREKKLCLTGKHL